MLHVIAFSVCLQAVAVGAERLQIGGIIVQSVAVNVVHVQLPVPPSFEPTASASFSFGVSTMLVATTRPAGLARTLKLVATRTKPLDLALKIT